MNFRKKTVVIEAYQFFEWNIGCHGVCSGGNEIPYPHIHTSKGVIEVSKGDWIIKDVTGEIYSCNPDFFQENYEKVSDEIEYQEAIRGLTDQVVEYRNMYERACQRINDLYSNTNKGKCSSVIGVDKNGVQYRLLVEEFIDSLDGIFIKVRLP